jgi:hypothetical protein
MRCKSSQPRKCAVNSIRLSFLLIIASPVILLGQPANTPEGGSPPDQKAPEKASGQEVPAPHLPEFRYTVSWNSENGAHFFVPGKWSELQLHLVNSRYEPREFLSATYFDQVPTLQFGRKVWVPPRSALSLPQPVLVPTSDNPDLRSLDLHSLLMDTADGKEALLRSSQGTLLHDATLLVTPTLRNTAVIGNSANGKAVPPPDVAQLIMSSRVSQLLNNRLTSWTDTFLPEEERFYGGVDHIILLDNRIVSDFVMLTTIRNWLSGGGHLWIMLDRTSPAVLEAIFGDDFQGHEVDRIGLTTVRVDKAPTVADPKGETGETFEYDESLPFVRMKNPGFDVIYSVNGWPAAMTKRYGDGRVFVTTLDARAWMQPKPNAQQDSDPDSMRAQLVPIGVMRDLAGEIFGQRETESLATESLEPAVREYIGYSVPSVGFVIGSLGSFLAVLIGLGLFLMKLQRLEYLAAIGSILAIAVSALLLFVGHSYRHGIPGTTASIQYSEALAGTDEVKSRGLLAVYHPEGSTSKIALSSGGELSLDMSGLENSNRRLVVTDFGTAYWDNLNQPAGMRTAPFKQSELIVDRLEAHATFDANGIIGKYSGAMAPGTDALIATRDGRIGTTIKPDGSFVARSDQVFKRDQYLDVSLLNDEQNRRRQTLEKLFTNKQRPDFPTRPYLMFWTDQIENGFRFDDSLQSRGATLVSVPLILDRPANGTEFAIPSTLLPYRVRQAPDGTPSSAMWSYSRKEWQERSLPGTSWLSFSIPSELLPLTIQRARVSVDVTGPIGRVEILGQKNNKVVSVETKLDPVGSITFDIADAEILSVDETGTVTLAVSGGDPSRPELTQAQSDSSMGRDSTNKGKSNDSSKVNYWRIESLRLQLWAKSTE